MNKIDLLIEEKRSMREKLRFHENAINVTLFAIFSLIGAVSGFLVQGEDVFATLQENKAQLYIFLLFQVQFTVSIYITTHLSIIQKLYKHVLGLNKHINTLNSKKINYWENEYVDFHFEWNGLNFMGKLTIYLFFSLLCFITFFIQIYGASYNCIYFVIVIFEIFQLAIVGGFISGVINGRDEILDFSKEKES